MCGQSGKYEKQSTWNNLRNSGGDTRVGHSAGRHQFVSAKLRYVYDSYTILGTLLQTLLKTIPAICLFSILDGFRRRIYCSCMMLDTLQLEA